jgi:putative membrane protein
VSEVAFFGRERQARITEAIRAVEAQTSAEVVVAVRHASGVYREADYMGGAIVALATLAILLFSPVVFAVAWMPFDVAIAFAVGAVFTANVPFLRRILVPPKRRSGYVRAAAREAFVDRGVSRTAGRNGILVFLSTFEREAVVVPDVGIDAKALGEGWSKALLAIEASAKALDPDALESGIRALGPALAAAMPHRDDDVNELPDEVDAS